MDGELFRSVDAGREESVDCTVSFEKTLSGMSAGVGTSRFAVDVSSCKASAISRSVISELSVGGSCE